MTLNDICKPVYYWISGCVYNNSFPEFLKAKINYYSSGFFNTSVQ